ncbi:hypothetical protein RZA67_09975 [Stenotrophomonas sp. C3(2023)]|uniref:hypothetical protein n=1 Tax=Stenotrophomonas sp. C3(2023) TaxID=3080277 RepID=UPI00293CCE85|nr:hypothetical protein [Stenotrophomonas sp. C3(2023)]MDV3469056.1 hypothetical protein [Stenotrophomonas sp. C3(2023)]
MKRLTRPAIFMLLALCALAAWFAPPAQCPWHPDFQGCRSDKQPDEAPDHG